jgi:cytochrome P450
MGCLGEQMPPECRKFVDSIRINFDATSKLMLSIPFHKLWRTKNWKRIVNALDYMWSFTGELVKEKMLEIEEKTAAVGNTDIHAELGDDFITYMILSRRMGAEEIAVNAIDMLGAAVDTVSASCINVAMAAHCCVVFVRQV